jgi:hypothetical protein
MKAGIILGVGIFLLFLSLFAGVCVLAAGPEATGILNISTDPEGASLEVDSGQTGITPALLEVPAGPRKVKISRGGYL